VVLALPEDMLVQSTDASICNAVKISEPAPTEQQVEECAEYLRNAARPLLLVGGSRWTDTGRGFLDTFIQKHPMPVATAFRYQDTVDNHSNCYVGDAGVAMTPQMQSLIKKADLILAVGIRLGEMTTKGYSLLNVPDAEQILVHVHPSDRELGKVYNPTLPVHAGPNQFIKALSEKAMANSCRPWLKQARSDYREVLDVPVQPGDVDMAAVTRVIAAQLPQDAIVTNGAGNFSIWPNRYLLFGPQQRLLAPQSGAMGYGLPAAIAAKQLYPNRLVLCFCGDGDFQMNCQELGTAMQINACPIVLIVNNGSYGTIRMHQERRYPARISGTNIDNPDFSRLASAYGFYAERVEKTDDFYAAFERARLSPTGAVLDLVTSIEALTPHETLQCIRSGK
jgi:acetolactate synthase-1/2/3 large subunit